MTVTLLLLLAHVLAAPVLAAALWRPARLLDGAVAAGATFFATYYGLPVLLGWITGLMTPWLLVVNTLAVVGAAGWLAWRGRAHARAVWPAARAALGRVTVVEWIVLLLILAQFVGSAFIALRMPARYGDAVAYHGVNAVRWDETRRFDLSAHNDAWKDSSAGAAEVFPNAKSIFAFSVMAFTGRQDGTGAVQIPFLPLLLVALYGIHRRLGLPRGIAMFALLFTLSSPELMMNSMDAYADIVFYAGVYTTIYTMMRLWTSGIGPRDLAFTGLAFAMMTSSKPQGLVAGGVLGVALLVLAVLRAPRPAWGTRLATTGLAVAWCTVFSLAIAGPWYTRGLVVYTNPLYPMKIEKGGVSLPGILALDTSTTMAHSRLKATGAAAVWKIMTEPYRPAIISPWDAGYGAHAFVLGIPLLVLFLCFILTGNDTRRFALFLLLMAILMLGSGSLLIPRYNYSLLGVMGVAFAWTLARTGWAFRLPLIVGFLGLHAYNVARVVPSVPFRAAPAELVVYTNFSGDNQSSWSRGFPEELRALDVWREAAPAGAVLAYEHLALTPWMRSETRGTRLQRVAPYDPAEGIAAYHARLRAAGATHLYLLADSPAFGPAIADRERFSVVYTGAATGTETHMMIVPRPEDVLLRVLPGGTP